MYWKQENKLRVVCTKKSKIISLYIYRYREKHFFTEVVQEFDFKPHYWKKHIWIKIFTAPNSSSPYLYPINVKEMRCNALPNRDGLLILGLICLESSSAKSTEISWQLLTVSESHSEIWGYPLTAVLLEMSPCSHTKSDSELCPTPLMKSSQRATTTNQSLTCHLTVTAWLLVRKYTDTCGLSVASRVETAHSDRNETALAPWGLPCSTETWISEKGMRQWTGNIYLNPHQKSNCLRHVYFCFVADRRHWQTPALRSSLES